MMERIEDIRGLDRMQEVRRYFCKLAINHRLLGHTEHTPHFVWLNDEKDMLLPSQMGYPFMLLGHNGYVVSEDSMQRRWNMMLSVQTHVSDTGSEAEKNHAANMCGRILDEVIARATSLEARLENKWLAGIDLDGANAFPVENEADALWGWYIEFGLSLPWCRRVEPKVWDDLKFLDV